MKALIKHMVIHDDMKAGDNDERCRWRHEGHAKQQSTSVPAVH